MKLFNYFALALGAGQATNVIGKRVVMAGDKAVYDSTKLEDVLKINGYFAQSCITDDILDKTDLCVSTTQKSNYEVSLKHMEELIALAPKSAGIKPMTKEEIAEDKDGNVIEIIEARTAALAEQGQLEARQLIQARKLKQLKVLILWLQPEHRFARYCFYGCWCLPDNDHRLFTVGYGKPVDNIDGSCKRQSQCYDCAQIDHPDRVCDPNTMGYSFKLHQDPSDPTNHWKKSIECTDNPKSSKGSCRRSICECDKKLAEDLRTYFSEWDVNNHQEQGTFDSATRCIVEGCKNGNCGGRTVECCGNLGSGPRMPYKTDGRRKCCGDKTYDSTFQECCEDGSLAAIGAC